MFVNFDFEKECELTDSKFFGEIALSSKQIENGNFSSEEMFVCQINLEQLSSIKQFEYLPKSGVLCFFIDMKKPPYKAIIRHFDVEFDSYLNFNEDLDFVENVIDEIGIEFCDDETYCEFYYEYDAQTMCLLKIEYFDKEPILPIYGDVLFLIDKEDLKRFDLSKAKLKIIIN